MAFGLGIGYGSAVSLGMEDESQDVDVGFAAIGAFAAQFLDGRPLGGDNFGFKDVIVEIAVGTKAVSALRGEGTIGARVIHAYKKQKWAKCPNRFLSIYG